MASSIRENPPSQPVPVSMETLSPSDVQRASLRDLVTLAAECRTAESNEAHWYQSSVEGSRSEYERVSGEVEARYDASRTEIEQQYQSTVQGIQTQYETAVRTLHESERTARSRFEQERSTIEREVKQKFNQAAWLAESVFEATQLSVRDQHKTGLEETAARAAEAESLENEADHLLYTIGYAWPSQDEPPPEIPPGEALNAFIRHRDATQDALNRLASLRLPRLLVGVTPFLLGLLICAAAAGLAQAATGTREPHWQALGAGAGIALIGCVAAGVLLNRKARAQVLAISRELRRSLDAAKVAAAAQRTHVEQTKDQRLAAAQARREEEINKAREQFQPILNRTAQEHQAVVSAVETESAGRMPRLEEKKARALAEAQEWHTTSLAELERSTEQEGQRLRERLEAHLRKLEQQHAQNVAELETRWRSGLVAIESPFMSTGSEGQGFTPWREDLWREWTPPQAFAQAIRFGEFQVDLKQITSEYPHTLTLPERFCVPALLSFPRHASLMIHADAAGRMQGLSTLQMIMLRLLTSLPPGRVRFTIIDPVGLGQNFAGFMHLADYDEALVGSRIWTEPEHIQQRLADLTEHMETVIQKYLRNEFETIDEYNAQAGELAEPYRFLVIADLPAALTDESLNRLSSIATTGARCGVYTLVVRDTRQALTNRSALDNLTAQSINLIRENGRYVWKDDVFCRFPLTLDPAASEDFLTSILHRVGKAAREAKRVEVAFRAIAPPDDRLWSGSTAHELSVPVGRMGATRLQTVRLGRGVAQHALIAGKTGSGKSTLLHVLITNLALWYSPDEVEFYLVDFKKGVEFKAYAASGLPHARAIAVESDREFGLSVLQRVDAELARRGALFRDAGVQDLAGYRQSPGAQPMPRTLLVIDEFQEFFSEDDRIAQDAGVLLDRLVRQGRAFGIHVLLGSQTIGGTSGLARSTLGQMAVRIALQTSEADSQLILGDNNLAARLLSRPGEAIYNDAGGLVEANSPFQVAWLPDEERERQLQRMHQVLNGRPSGHAAAIVFEGNVPADIRENPALARQIATPPRGAPEAPRLWLGEPVAIKEPTHVVLRPQSGANVLMVGQQDEPALALLCAAMVSMATQHPPGTATIYLLDGTPVDSPLAGAFERVCSRLPIVCNLVDYRGVGEVMGQLAAELNRRQSSSEARPPAVYLLVYGLQRYRVLRKQEDSFSFGGGGESTPQPDRQFADLLRDGPPLGMHTLAWIDTIASLERTLDRGSVREFDHRVLFQMSANDSSTLIDSPLANKLGMNRALVYSEEQGIVEKFRPYALPPTNWLEEVSGRLKE